MRYLNCLIVMLAGVIALSGCTRKLPDDVILAYESLPAEIDFNEHIRPILSDRCFTCHGPDNNTREASLRLDTEEAAFSRLTESRGHAFVRGNPHKSMALQRIVSDDPSYIMPPPVSNLHLTAIEKAMIAKWIDEGAKWKDHWSFIPPEKVVLPEIDDFVAAKVINPIDLFVLRAQQEKGLSFSEEADPERLLRRVTLGLTGLPPSIDAIDAFLAASSADAYETVVDQLLETDAYAERMAMEWLDVARYADSHGMHSDLTRYNWPWRDWVIDSFRENMPYNKFITLQIAGDLIPDATKEQKLATAFLRNHPTTAEGGAVNEEFRQKYVQDRTNTTATAFLGLTMECAGCHDHKFDPVSQKEYYEMTAFFNNIKELGMQAEVNIKEGYSSGPTMLMPDADTEKRLEALAFKIDQTLKDIQDWRTEYKAPAGVSTTPDQRVVQIPEATGLFPFESIEPADMDLGNVHRIVSNMPIDKIVDGNKETPASGNPEVVTGKVGNAIRSVKERELIFLKDVADFEMNEPYSAGAWIKMEKENTTQTIIGNSGELGNAWRGWDFYLDPDNKLNLRITSAWPHNYMQVTSLQGISSEDWQHVFFSYDGSGKAEGIRLFVNGQQIAHEIPYDKLYKTIIHTWRKKKGWDNKPVMVGRSGRFHTGENGVFEGAIDQVAIFHEQLTALEIAKMVHADDNTALDFSSLSPELVRNHHLERHDGTYLSLMRELQQLQFEKITLLADVPEIMVMEEMAERRKTYVLDRGQYDAPLEEVVASTPVSVLPFSEDLPRNRLGLAKWLTDPQNPLTARVTVNRYWQMIFGSGLVDTPHDFGMQGASPSHPQLLDWLAVTFVESGWDVKALVKRMVMSATYRQSSVLTEQLISVDPKNKWLARGPSYRMPAETIRDVALASSGLLTEKTGGESVKPYQPAGLWAEKTGAHMTYHPDSGDSLYRRSMYTYVRRTTPHPAMIAFDAPDRSVCTVQRENTNTPLQALVLLNDPQFVEAARVLAERMQDEGGDDLVDQITYAFRLVTGRMPSREELGLFEAQYLKGKEKYDKYPDEARKLMQVGAYPFDKKLDTIETAALTMVASTLLNHDEAYMMR